MVFTVTVCSFHLAFHVVAVWDHQDDIFKNYKVAVKTEKKLTRGHDDATYFFRQ